MLYVIGGVLIAFVVVLSIFPDHCRSISDQLLVVVDTLLCDLEP